MQRIHRILAALAAFFVITTAQSAQAGVRSDIYACVAGVKTAFHLSDKATREMQIGDPLGAGIISKATPTISHYCADELRPLRKQGVTGDIAVASVLKETERFALAQTGERAGHVTAPAMPKPLAARPASPPLAAKQTPAPVAHAALPTQSNILPQRVAPPAPLPRAEVKAAPMAKSETPTAGEFSSVWSKEPAPASAPATVERPRSSSPAPAPVSAKAVEPTRSSSPAPAAAPGRKLGSSDKQTFKAWFQKDVTDPIGHWWTTRSATSQYLLQALGVIIGALVMWLIARSVRWETNAPEAEDEAVEDAEPETEREPVFATVEVDSPYARGWIAQDPDTFQETAGDRESIVLPFMRGGLTKADLQRVQESVRVRNERAKHPPISHRAARFGSAT
jgi:hypothetical protein